MNGNAELARRLFRARRQARLTQEQLAKRLGRSQSFVSLAESGKARVGDRYVTAVLKACCLDSEWGAADSGAAKTGTLTDGETRAPEREDFVGLDPETLELVVRGSARDEELSAKYFWWSIPRL